VLFRSEDRTADSGLPADFPADALARFRASLSAFPASLEKTILGIVNEFGSFSDHELRERILVRVERYFSQVSRRPGLMRVFHTPASWLGDFCKGLAASELLAVLLTHHPGLVEGVATASGICPGFASWEKAGVRLLRTIDDYAESLEWIRRLKNERLLQLALADLRGDFSHEVLERELSSLADFVMQHTYERVRRNLGLDSDIPLAVLALGRLGSQEMSYLSDLDLVFVYQPRPDEPDDLIPAQVVRFVQRFMRMLSTPLHEGPGYAVDARLRPTGTYGPLIVTRSSWLDYYRHQADLWEVQALLRVRNVAGSRELGVWIEEQAQEICYRKRDSEEVWSRICHLRGRMQQERSEEKGEQIDIKLGLGGLADLEFLAQGYALTNGYRIPSLRGRSVRSALRSVLENVPNLQGSALEVMAAFETLRSLEHRLRLHRDLAASRLNPQMFEALKHLRLWPPRHGATDIEDWLDLIRLRRRVRSALQHFCPEL
jgi:glutamate-ammonia-ligase adenylyltransferase